MQHCYHQNVSCIQMGTRVSRFNDSLIVTTQSQDFETTTFQERKAEADSNLLPAWRDA